MLCDNITYSCCPKHLLQLVFNPVVLKSGPQSVTLSNYKAKTHNEAGVLTKKDHLELILLYVCHYGTETYSTDTYLTVIIINFLQIKVLTCKCFTTLLLQTRLSFLICPTPVMKGRWWRRGVGSIFFPESSWQSGYGLSTNTGIILSVCLQGVDKYWLIADAGAEILALEPTLWVLGLKLHLGFKIFNVNLCQIWTQTFQPSHILFCLLWTIQTVTH